jgi:membrane protein implicated in regulation of membrane protease activity
MVIAEMLTLAVFAAFGAVAAVAAAIAAALGADILVQGIVFAVVAIGGVVLARPPLMRYLARRKEPVLLSGAAGMVGQTAVVVDTVNGPQQPGHVQIQGEKWLAVSADGSPLEPGRTVNVVEIRQTTLVVAPP